MIIVRIRTLRDGYPSFGPWRCRRVAMDEKSFQVVLADGRIETGRFCPDTVYSIAVEDETDQVWAGDDPPVVPCSSGS